MNDYMIRATAANHRVRAFGLVWLYGSWILPKLRKLCLELELNLKHSLINYRAAQSGRYLYSLVSGARN